MDYGYYDQYSDEMQNLGLRRREHERCDQLLKEERLFFGFGEGMLRKAEALNRLTDDNGFEEDPQ